MTRSIKIMYRYMIRAYVPLLLVTTLVSWFIVLMQFLWQHIDDLVGKGLSVSVLLQVMFYAALYVLPTALPLGVLLASLMTFGGLGERLELLAIKSAGVSLGRIMKPLMVLVLGIAVALFVYLDRGVQHASVKVYQILFSARYARPELEIPEGVFFNGIDGYSLYVGKKDPKTGLLCDVMIYDLSNQSLPRIILADTGRLLMDDSKLFMTMSLRRGESFEQLGSASIVPGADESADRPASYIKEYFSSKEIFIPFDANFELMGDDYLRSQFVGKTLHELIIYSDSTRVATDSIGRSLAQDLLQSMHMRLSPYDYDVAYSERMLSTTQLSQVIKGGAPIMRHTQGQYLLQDGELHLGASLDPALGQHTRKFYSLDTLLAYSSVHERLSGYKQAVEGLSDLNSSARSAESYFSTAAEDYRVNAQEMHRKFTLPVSCILFFFVGAPLGAIVRKGGVGTPMVMAVIIFIIYYVVDTFGLKMINGGEIPVWAGMWLSSSVILPLGVFLTYKASRDSSSLNADAYVNFLRRLFVTNYQRDLEYKEFFVTPVPLEQVIVVLKDLETHLELLTNTTYYRSYGKNPIDFPRYMHRYRALQRCMREVEYVLGNYPDKYVFSQLLALPRLEDDHRFLGFVCNLHYRWIFLVILPVLQVPLLVEAWHIRFVRRHLSQIQMVMLTLRTYIGTDQVIINESNK